MTTPAPASSSARPNTPTGRLASSLPSDAFLSSSKLARSESKRVPARLNALSVRMPATYSMVRDEHSWEAFVKRPLLCAIALNPFQRKGSAQGTTAKVARARRQSKKASTTADSVVFAAIMPACDSTSAP